MGVGVGVGVGVVSGVSGGTRSGGDEQTQIQNTFQGREHFTAIEGQGLHDTGSGCESRGLERESSWKTELTVCSWGAVDGWQLAVGIGVDDWL